MLGASREVSDILRAIYHQQEIRIHSWRQESDEPGLAMADSSPNRRVRDEHSRIGTNLSRRERASETDRDRGRASPSGRYPTLSFGKGGED